MNAATSAEVSNVPRRSTRGSFARPSVVTRTFAYGLPSARSSADALAFAQTMIAAAKAVIDVVALPAETPLLKAARAAGKPCITGDAIGMLQALEQFVLYTGITPTAEQVDTAAAFARGG